MVTMSSRLTFRNCRKIRLYSTKAKMTITENVDKLLQTNETTFRHHPGTMRCRQVEQPKWLLDEIKILVKDSKISLKEIDSEAKELISFLYYRQTPKEQDEISSRFEEIISKIQKDNTNDSVNEMEKHDLIKHKEVYKHMKGFVHTWKPINYDRSTCLAYLVGRSVPEYSVLYKIFYEINTNNKDFAPKTLFDYGSGVGTVMWAASKFWNKSLKEYFCIDTSADMNEYSEHLIKKAVPQINNNYVFYRQFFPASPVPTYDIVVSAYSLMEMSNQTSRLEIIKKLWNKTAQYLILVEQGTRYGFKIIEEARDFILKCAKKPNCHVFAPCPHDLQCPNEMVNNDVPCSFKVSYLTLPICGKSEWKTELYSYVVLKKGKRPEDDNQWPRIIRPVMKRSKHVICRLCTSSGKLEEQIFTRWKNGKNTYRCARTSRWGDRLPFKSEDIEKSE